MQKILYRGVSDKDNHLLLSTMGRLSLDISEINRYERELLDSYKKLPFNKNLSKYKLDQVNDDMFYLSLGRHIGLNCRLLDWTSSIDVAEYFASCNPLDMNKTGCVWRMEIPDDYFNRTHYERKSPFEMTDIISVVKIDYCGDSISEFPEPIRRRFVQNGFFSISKLEYINTPINELELGEIKILEYKEISPCNKRGNLKRLKEIGERILLTNEEIEVLKLNNKTNMDYGKKNDL